MFSTGVAASITSLNSASVAFANIAVMSKCASHQLVLFTTLTLPPCAPFCSA